MAGKPLKQQKLKLEDIAKVLKKNLGLISPTAEALNVTYHAIYNRIQNSPKLQKIRADIREKICDKAESKLFENLNDGNMTAVIFYLKTQARHRGYVERHETELSTKGNTPLKIERVIVEKKDTKD